MPKIRRAPPVSETAEQITIVAYLRKFGFIDDVIWTHIRAERNNAQDGIKAKKTGVNRSFPDFLFINNGDHLWIEMKKRGTLARWQRTKRYTEHEIEQFKMHERLRANGDIAVIRETLEEVLSVLRFFHMPVRNEPLSNERLRAGILGAIDGAEE